MWWFDFKLQTFRFSQSLLETVPETNVLFAIKPLKELLIKKWYFGGMLV